MPLDPSLPFVPLAIAVLTVSDTRTQADDRSGDTLVDRLTRAGHRLASRAIVPDDVEAIRARGTVIPARAPPSPGGGGSTVRSTGGEG